MPIVTSRVASAKDGYIEKFVGVERKITMVKDPVGETSMDNNIVD